jgi:L-seryl-tRNA(Ser) seleniumtransferase
MPNEDFEAGAMSLADTLEVARTAGIPVIVDAAAELPPPSNLWYFTRQLGADLAVFSGGKALCGPPGAGIVVGRRDLVDACRRIGHPHNGVGRAMKVSKEDVAGLLQAIESFLSLDHVGRQKRFVSTLDYWEETIGRLPGIQAVRVRSSRIDRSEWRIRLIVDPGVTGLTAAEIRAKLWHGEPRIAVMVPAQGGEVQLTPYTLQPGEDVIVATAFADAIGKCLSC